MENRTAGERTKMLSAGQIEDAPRNGQLTPSRMYWDKLLLLHFRVWQLLAYFSVVAGVACQCAWILNKSAYWIILLRNRTFLCIYVPTGESVTLILMRVMNTDTLDHGRHTSSQKPNRLPAKLRVLVSNIYYMGNKKVVYAIVCRRTVRFASLLNT